MADGTLKQLLWQLQASRRELEARLPRDDKDSAMSRLRLQRPDDRVLVLRYLYETRANGGIDRDQWRRLYPELWTRLLEICPLRPIDPRTGSKVRDDE
jgi:hypothetical protein